VGIFRKKETYNEQMLREAGLDRVVFRDPASPSEAEPESVVPPSTVPKLGSDRMDRKWDTATTARAPGVQGDSVEFTVLPEGDLIIGNENVDGDLTPLADAVEEHLSPPYKATASRQDGDLWGVGAKRIEVAQFSFPDADELVLSQNNGVSEFRVDGEPSDATAPVTLQRLGERDDADFCVGAERIDGDYWEVKVSPL
jgi:hypothetical protein